MPYYSSVFNPETKTTDLVEVSTEEAADIDARKAAAAAAASAEPTLAEKKAAREADLENLTVSYGGNDYNANDAWISRLARAVLVMERTEQASISWPDATETERTLTVEDMSELLKLAQEAQNAKLLLS